MRDQVGHLLPRLAPILIIVVPHLAMLGPPRLRIEVHAENLVVTMLGWDALFAYRRRITIPVEVVEGVCVCRRDQVPEEGHIKPGTSIWRIIRAGSFGAGETRDFWDVRRGKMLLVIEMKPGAEYRRLVLEVPDAHARALELRPALGAIAVPLVPELRWMQ